MPSLASHMHWQDCTLTNLETPYGAIGIVGSCSMSARCLDFVGYRAPRSRLPRRSSGSSGASVERELFASGRRLALGIVGGPV